MVNPVPASKAAEAFRELIKLRAKEQGIDEFTLARFERAGSQSLQVDPLAAHMLLGILAAVRWDEDSVRVHFEHAIAIGGGHVALANYSRALYDINRIRDVIEPIEQAVASAPEVLDYLRQAITYRFVVGDWDRAAELLETLALRSPDVGADMVNTGKKIALARELGLQGSTVRNSVGIAFDLLAAERVRVASIEDWADDIIEDGGIYFDILVQASIEIAQDLDDRLTPLLFDGVDDLQLSVFGLAIKSVEAQNGTN